MVFEVTETNKKTPDKAGVFSYMAVGQTATLGFVGSTRIYQSPFIASNTVIFKILSRFRDTGMI